MTLAKRRSEQGGYATIPEPRAQRPIIALMFGSATVFLGKPRIRRPTHHLQRVQ
jgi:hypothetical protein